MRENRQSGSEGGGAGTTGSLYPYTISTVPRLIPVTSTGMTGRGAARSIRLIPWEIPRLCRGDSRSLTFPGVVSGHPSMKLRFVSRQSTRTMEFHQWTSSRA
jgi:hypothetical protein